MYIKYSVVVEDFAKRHFIKKFEKKYKTAWDITKKAITEEFKRIDELFDTEIADKIIEKDNIRIVKTEFRVAGTKYSRKKLGNRCIVAVHKDTQIVHIILLYHKTDLGNKNETNQWKNIIKQNYPQYRDIM